MDNELAALVGQILVCLIAIVGGGVLLCVNLFYMVRDWMLKRDKMGGGRMVSNG